MGVAGVVAWLDQQGASAVGLHVSVWEMGLVGVTAGRERGTMSDGFVFHLFIIENMGLF